jgi:hypothetical protein
MTTFRKIARIALCCVEFFSAGIATRRTQSRQRKGEVVLAKLAPPIYPPQPDKRGSPAKSIWTSKFEGKGRWPQCRSFETQFTE